MGDVVHTQLTDVAKELMHYKKHFKDKIVFCNCDDPTWSAFWKYFHLNFAELGLKKLISTHYDREEATYKMEYTGGDDNDIEAGVKRNCVAGQMADGYIKGNPIRQDYLEKVLSWIADRDDLESGQMYMAIHQHDADANDLWLYFQMVINWAKMLFPKSRKGMTNVQEWGLLYNKYHNKQYNSNTLEADVQRLLMDDDVTKNAGIIPYILSDRTKHDEKFLSICSFSEAQKRRAYERQGHKCPCCVKNGIDKEYAYNEMQGDHIIPWSQGGRTIDSNLQMLCQKCNNDKSNQ